MDMAANGSMKDMVSNLKTLEQTMFLKTGCIVSICSERQLECCLRLAANDGGMVSWGLEITTLSTQ